MYKSLYLWIWFFVSLWTFSSNTKNVIIEGYGLKLIETFSQHYTSSETNVDLYCFNTLRLLLDNIIFKNHDKCKYITYSNNKINNLYKLYGCLVNHIEKQLQKNNHIIDDDKESLNNFSTIKSIIQQYPNKIVQKQIDINNHLQKIINNRDFHQYGGPMLIKILIPLYNRLINLYMNVLNLYLPASGPLSIFYRYQPIYDLLNIQLDKLDTSFTIKSFYNLEEIFENLKKHSTNPLIKQHFHYILIDQVCNNFEKLKELYMNILKEIVDSPYGIFYNDICFFRQYMDKFIHNPNKNYEQLLNGYENLYYFFMKINESFHSILEFICNVINLFFYDGFKEEHNQNINLSVYEELMFLIKSPKITKFIKEFLLNLKKLLIKLFNDYIEINILIHKLINHLFLDIKKHQIPNELSELKHFLVLHEKYLLQDLMDNLLKIFFFTNEKDKKQLLDINFILYNNELKVFFNKDNIYKNFFNKLDNPWIKNRCKNIKIKKLILTMINLKKLICKINKFKFKNTKNNNSENNNK